MNLLGGVLAALLLAAPVDQGAPGTQGAWMVRVSGPVVCLIDGGTSGGGTSSVVVVDGGVIAITNFPATQPVTGTFWPPSQVVTVDSGTVDARITNLPGNLLTDGGVVNVGNFPATQAVSGTVTANQGTSPWNVSGTVSTTPGIVTADGGYVFVLQSGEWHVLVDGGQLNVGNFPASQAVTGTFWPNLQVVLIDAGTVDAHVTNFPGNLLTDGGVVNVGNFPATQAVSGTVAVSNFPATQTVAGTVTANQGGAWSSTVTQATGSNLHVAVDSAPSTAVTGTFWPNLQVVLIDAGTVDARITNFPGNMLTDGGVVNVGNFPATQAVSGTVAVSNFPATQTVAGTVAATQSGTWTVQPGNTANTTAWKVDGSAVTQPVSGTVTANAGSGSFTVAQATGTNLHTVVDSAPTTAVSQSGTWTMQPGNTANTTAWKVDGSAVTQPVSGTVTANQGGAPWAENVTQFGGTNVSTGTGASGVGIPRVTVANDSNVLATQSGTWNVTNVSGTVSLPTGAATSANQSTLGSQTTKINDGTNTAAVKAASTSAGATDPALVVNQSPNGGNPCQNPSSTLTGISGSTSGTAATQIIALSGSTKIYICSMTITGVSGTTPTFSLVTGTGANCVTGQAVLIGAWTTTANTVFPFSGTVAIGPAGAALCYLDTGTTPIQRYALTYVQQ